VQAVKQCRENEQFKRRAVIEKTLEELESIQMEDEDKNVLVTVINLVINSGEAKAMELHVQHYNKIQRESTS
jgi:hypothetical protein